MKILPSLCSFLSWLFLYTSQFNLLTKKYGLLFRGSGGCVRTGLVRNEVGKLMARKVVAATALGGRDSTEPTRGRDPPDSAAETSPPLPPRPDDSPSKPTVTKPNYVQTAKPSPDDIYIYNSYVDE